MYGHSCHNSRARAAVTVKTMGTHGFSEVHRTMWEGTCSLPH
ncbi:hypothetical protein PFWH6_4450 [Pseudomonas fluorescens WH6]|nr:hypothetical protein PFWH6_4450 [Pseudomonas fluorescens WH6]